MKSNPRVGVLWRRIRLRFLLPVFALGVWTCVPRASAAQSDNHAVPSVVASALDEQTIAVVAIDATRVDLNTPLRQLSAIPVLNERQRADLALHKKSLEGGLAKFRKAGGREIWILVTLADDLLDNPLVIVPLSDGVDRQAIVALFVRSNPESTEDHPINMESSAERNGGLFFGSKAALQRLKSFHGPTRAIPKAALEAVASAEIRAFVLPTADQRRVLREFLRDPDVERATTARLQEGTVPPEFLRNPNEIPRLALGEGVQWLAAGIETRENVALKLVIGSKDALSAKALELWQAGAWQYAGQKIAAQKGPNSAMIASLLRQLARLLAPKVERDQLTIRIDMNQLMASAAGAFISQATAGTAAQADNAIVKNRLRQLALAMHNYLDVHKQFPPAAIRGAGGRRLLSWRVALLPFLEQNELYQQFHLDEPWDSPHNKPLIAKMPAVFRPRRATLRAEGKTTMLVPVGKQTVFGDPEGISISDITDGTSNTIMIVDADEGRAVPWTKPDDLHVDGVDVKQVLFGTQKEAIYCAFADGSVHRIDPQVSADTLRALLTRNGGEIVTLP